MSKVSCVILWIKAGVFSSAATPAGDLWEPVVGGGSEPEQAAPGVQRGRSARPVLARSGHRGRGLPARPGRLPGSVVMNYSNLKLRKNLNSLTWIAEYLVIFLFFTILDNTSYRGLQIRDTVCPAREDMASTTTWAASIQEVVKVWVESLMARRIKGRNWLWPKNWGFKLIRAKYWA